MPRLDPSISIHRTFAPADGRRGGGAETPASGRQRRKEDDGTDNATNSNAAGSGQASDGEDPLQQAPGRGVSSHPAPLPTDGQGAANSAGGGQRDDRRCPVENNAVEPLDWPAIYAFARSLVLRGLRFWGPTRRTNPAPNSLSLEDCIQQAITDVLKEGMPRTNREACYRVGKRLARVWKTYLETSLRQHNIKAGLSHNYSRTLTEILTEAAAAGDAKLCFICCFEALRDSPNAKMILFMTLHDGCDWSDHARMKRDLGLTKAEVDKAKSEIQTAIRNFLSDRQR